MESKNSTRRGSIYLFGDSLTQFGYNAAELGWVSKLSDVYARKADVINRGLSGYNTRWGKYAFANIFPLSDQKKQEFNSKFYESADAKDKRIIDAIRNSTETDNCNAELLVIFFGGNDAAIENRSQHISLDEFSKNLSEIIEIAQTSNQTKIILITPPPLCDPDWEKFLKTLGLETDRFNEITKKYADVVKEVGNKYGLPVVDIYERIEGLVKAERDEYIKKLEEEGKIEQVSKWYGYSGYLTDGLHLAKKGNSVLFEMLIESINSNFPSLFENIFSPLWDKIANDEL
ncbi:hypothetical protein BB559_003563 [Furculomyces boomerangus]|uniref:Uncharacterized protein n=1 Tax=Furculomyces boomerangus TaxID=61424 RepID=A0A2T9YKJ8_9FUNG|nr:hypothetical protein BB559_003563 [Furculomyces boomerangus]